MAYQMTLTRPRVFCTKCHRVEYCDDHRQAEFPPDAAKKALNRKHKPCDGKIEYMAGIALRGRPQGMES